MRPFAITLLSICILFAPISADAARKLRQVQPTAHELRLVIVTAPGCIYCRVFRRDIAPLYENSSKNANVPLVYIDINDAAADELVLKSPIQVVPTAVLVDGTHELNRISGYLGPSNFFTVFKHMLARHEAHRPSTQAPISIKK